MEAGANTRTLHASPPLFDNQICLDAFETNEESSNITTRTRHFTKSSSHSTCKLADSSPMRTLSLLPLVYLAYVRQTYSFPGKRQQGTATSNTEQRTLPPEIPLEDRVLFIKKSHENEHHQDEAVAQAAAVEIAEELHSKKEFESLQQQRKTTFVISLAAVSGALDIVCLKKFGCFAHLMTGNTVKCLSAAMELKWKEASFYAGMVAFYTAGAAGYRLVDILNSKHKENKYTATMEVMTFAKLSTVLLPVFALSDLLVQVLHGPTAAVAFMWAFGGGVVNASTMDGIGVVTSAVTGHWNKLGIAVCDILVRRRRNNVTKITFKVLGATALALCVTKFLYGRFNPRVPVGLVIGLTYYGLFRWYGNGPR